MNPHQRINIQYSIAMDELPDVVITDTRMPKLDGTGLIKAMRDDPRLATVPAIILTARNQVADREAARESGADLVMDKPFNPRELRTAIQDLFAKQHRQASNFMNEQARSFEIISAGLAHEMHNPLAYIKNANFVIGENAKKVMAAAKNPELSPEERDVVFEKAKEKIEAREEELKAQLLALEDDSDSDDTDDSDEEEE